MYTGHSQSVLLNSRVRTQLSGGKQSSPLKPVSITRKQMSVIPLALPHVPDLMKMAFKVHNLLGQIRATNNKKQPTKEKGEMEKQRWHRIVRGETVRSLSDQRGLICRHAKAHRAAPVVYYVVKNKRIPSLRKSKMVKLMT